MAASPLLPSYHGTQDYEVAVLPYRLSLVRLPKSNIAHSTHTLMRLLFFPNPQQQMFSFTEALDDVTLILDHETLATFPEGVLEVSNITWRALQVFAGAEGQAMNLIRSVSDPLADACISIMQVSTYESDFTLVPEYDLRKAVRCLSETFTVTDVPEDLFAPEMDDVYDQLDEDCLSDGSDGQTTSCRKSSFSIALPSPPEYNSEEEDEPDTTQEHSSSSPSPKSSNSRSNSASTLVGLPSDLSDTGTPSSKSSFSKISDSHPPPNMHAHFPDELYITSIDEHSLPSLSLRLIKLLFFSERQDRFLSFTRSTSNTISIIMDAETLSRFEPHTLHMVQGRWRLIRIGPEHEGVEGEGGYNCNCGQNGEGVWGMGQFGVFRDSVEPLIQEGISEIFYLSTFSNDWLMVPDQDFPKAQKALQAAYAPLSMVAASQIQTNPNCPSVFFSPKPKANRRRSVMYRRRRNGSENSGKILHRSGGKGNKYNRRRSTSTCSICSLGSSSSYSVPSLPSLSSSSTVSTLFTSPVSSSAEDTFLAKSSNPVESAIDELASKLCAGVDFGHTVEGSNLNF